MFLFMPSLYPGVNMYLSMLIAIIITVPTGLVYGFLSASMPRSGGDYVYVSRILGPALGTMANWNITIWWFFYGGVPSAVFLRFCIFPMFRVLRAYTRKTPILRAAHLGFSAHCNLFFCAVFFIVF